MTLREKAEYYDEWEPCFESLARIRRVVKGTIASGVATTNGLIDDAEVRPEIQLLIEKMLEEMRND